ncbi:MAG: quinolinate synthase NadA [Candidatus Omnitrophica bacterium]|nr:quinolinate synthase NadA [Candidatus Omnitrophota bacterium]MCM8769208.1 quinolinate synthase NadA [Candidatus Omnitrophota bacterium]
MIKLIQRLKEEKKAVILAHNYQQPEIQDLADFVGDSLELAREASQLKECRLIVFCGVRFMAETAKILSPGKRVVLPVNEAGCPLADMVTPADVLQMKKKYPGAVVVSYVNTSAEVKALSDVCCTSANAVSVVEKVPAKQIIFLPDRNLGWYVQQRLPEKKILLGNGYCFVHERFTVLEVKTVREKMPEAEIVVHPECKPEVQKLADGVYSTSGMLRRARESPARKMVIGTEVGLLHRLKKENPGKEFYCLGTAKICPNMKKTDLKSVLEALSKEEPEIRLSEEVISLARAALERMLLFV